MVDKGNVKGDDAKGKKGKSAGKAKGKTTPAVDTEASVPVPSLPPTEMKKRGEEGDGPPPISMHLSTYILYMYICIMYVC